MSNQKSIANIQSGRVNQRMAELVAPNMMTEFQRRKAQTIEQRNKDWRKKRDKDFEEVIGTFHNLEQPGAFLEFRVKFYDEQPEKYHLEHGNTYRVPRCVARHINTNTFYNEYKPMNGLAGSQGIRSGTPYVDGRYRTEADMQMARKVPRFAFYSIDFSDDEFRDEMTLSPIIEIKK